MFARPEILPLDADESSRFLPWTVAFMTYLATLALAGAMALAAMTARFDPGQVANITVELPPLLAAAGGGEKKSTGGGDEKARIAAALDLVRTTPGVIAAEALGRGEVEKLLEPWLGETAKDPDLPLPAIIDVTVEKETEIDTAGLAAKLAAAVPGATLDDHGMWFARVTVFVHSVQLVAGLVVALTCLAAVLTVIYVTLSGLAVHHDIIEMLHVIGAEDGYIAGQFQGHALRLGLAGAVPGLLMAVLTVELLALAAGQVDSFLLPNVRLAPAQWLALALVPVAAGMIAMLTARITVMRRLSRMV
jgi:cell division transport system permease protein